MKRKKILYIILMYLPLAAALAAWQFLPGKIPAHYGFDGQVTRWGSRLEAFLFPLVTILMGYFLLAMAKLATKQEGQGRNNEKAILTAGIFTLIPFNALSGYFLYTALRQTENLAAVPLALHRLVLGLLGVLLMAVGNLMPKMRRNSIAGLRTRWSMKNEVTWKKSQRFGGVSFMVGGLLMIGGSLSLEGAACAAFVLILWVMLLLIDVFYTYQVAKKN